MLIRTVFPFLVSIFFIFFPQNAHSAELIWRTDLAYKIKRMQRLFPARSNDVVVGAKKALEYGFGGNNQLLDEFSDTNEVKVLYLSGPIEHGDAKKLGRKIEELKFAGPYIIGLNSQGGAFEEAFRIGNRLEKEFSGQDPTLMGVMIFAPDSCLSACAVVFASSVDLVHNISDRRFIENGAQLGFHMPYFSPKLDLNLFERQKLLEEGYDAAATMTKLIENNANPPELLTKTLKQRSPGALFRLGGDIEGWRFGFSPVATIDRVRPITASGLDTAAVGQLCNLVLTTGGMRMTAAENEFCDFRLGGGYKPKNPGGDLISKLRDSSRSAAFSASCTTFTCQIRIDRNENIGIAVWRGNEGCPDHIDFPDDMCTATPVGVDRVTNFLLSAAFGCHSDELIPNLFEGEDYHAYAKRDVNVRRTPTVNAEIVTRLKKSTLISVNGCKRTEDGQGVWYRIMSHGGLDGWVSARFVAGQFKRFQF